MCVRVQGWGVGRRGAWRGVWCWPSCDPNVGGRGITDAGGPEYQSARAREEQCGAVEQRAWNVHLQYEAHARRLDGTAPNAPAGPVLTRLRSYTPTRGLAFGAYGECSSDVHSLIDLAADGIAAKLWRLLGARSKAEARSFIVARLRRRLGLVATREMARHRLRRLPYVGAPRSALSQRRDRQGPGARAAEAGAGIRLADFAGIQARLAAPA